MLFQSMVIRFGVARSTTILTVLCTVFSVGLYLALASAFAQIRTIGVFISLITPVFAVPPVCSLLLRTLRSLHSAKREVEEARTELETRVRERTSELTKTNEKLLAEMDEKRKAEESLRKYQENLEDLVRQRTAALEKEIHDHKVTEQALRESEKKYRAMFEQAMEGIFQTTPEGKVLSANPAFARMFDYDSPEEAVARITDIGSQLYVHRIDRERLRSLLAEKGSVVGYEAEALTRRGRRIWVSINVHEVRDPSGALLCYEGTNQDITRHKEAEEELRESEERYRIAIEHSNDGVAVAKEGRHIFVNRRFLEMFGYRNLDEVNGHEPFSNVHPDDRVMVCKYYESRLRGENAPSRYEFKGIRTDGSVIHIETSTAVITHQGEPASLAFLRDVTERKEFEARLRTMSIVDELTGLYNRRGFLTLCAQQMKVAEREGKGMELFFIDLDGMKQINDTLGHKAGDSALVDVTDVLRQTFREADILGRIGGDEFAVLAVNAGEESREEIMRRLRDVLDSRNKGRPQRPPLSLSIGSASYDPQNPDTLDQLLARADSLMYEEKWDKQQRASGL